MMKNKSPLAGMMLNRLSEARQPSQPAQSPIALQAKPPANLTNPAEALQLKIMRQHQVIFAQDGAIHE